MKLSYVKMAHVKAVRLQSLLISIVVKLLNGQALKNEPNEMLRLARDLHKILGKL